MIPVDQTKLHDPGKVNGNCYAACIASLIEVSLEEMPLIEDMGIDCWFEETKRFLDGKGYVFHGCVECDSYEDLEAVYEHIPNVDGYRIAFGLTNRFKTVQHAVIYKDGKMVHDPHPSKDGLTNLLGFDFIERKSDV